MPKASRPARYAELLRMTGLGPFASRLAGRLSGGMKQKLGLACTLIRSPRLLLDEPTVGVDPISRRELWQIIYRLVREEGMSVLLSTAYLDKAERCSEVILLHDGRVLGQDAPEQFSESMRGRTFLASARDIGKRRLQALLNSTPGVLDALIEGSRIQGVQRRFGNFYAVRDVSFSVRRGEIFGLLGANGAGKSTTFRMLCGLLPASAGELTVAGHDLRRAAAQARSRIGYMAQRFSLYANLTVNQNLDFFASAYVLRGVFLQGDSYGLLFQQYWPMGLIGIISLALAGWLFRHRMY